MQLAVFFVVTGPRVWVFYRRDAARQEAMDLAHELALKFDRPSRVRRVRSRPYYSARQRRVLLG